MVAPEDDDRIIAQAQCAELRQDATGVPIHPSRRGEVSPNHFACRLWRRIPTDKEVGITRPNRSGRKPLGNRRARLNIGGERYLIGIKEIEKSLGRSQRAVRFAEPAGEEEPLLTMLAEHRDCLIGDTVVAASFVVAFQDDPSI